MLLKILKWALIVLGALIIILVVAGWWLKSDTERAFDKVFEVTPKLVNIPSDSASLAKGQRWAQSLCTSCHGFDLAGYNFFSDPALGTVDAPNLTSGKGGIGMRYTNIDWIRTIKHGVRPNGTAVMAMPAKDFAFMGDEDLGCLIAYLKMLPPVDHQLKSEPELTTFGKILIGAGAFGEVFDAETIDHNMGSAYVPETGKTSDYGTYLVNVAGCRNCHGQGMNGGKDPDPNAPFGPNITPGGNITNWSSDDFINTFRTGITPEGKKLSKYMPWKSMRHFNDTELTAIYQYLVSLPKMQDAEMIKQ